MRTTYNRREVQGHRDPNTVSPLETRIEVAAKLVDRLTTELHAAQVKHRALMEEWQGIEKQVEVRYTIREGESLQDMVDNAEVITRDPD